MFSKMSPRAIRPFLERIDGVASCRHADGRFQCFSIDDINWSFEKAFNVQLNPCILEHSDFRLGVQFDHNIDIAVGTSVTSRDRAKYGSVRYTAGAQCVRVPLQNAYDITLVHMTTISKIRRKLHQP